MTAPYGNSSIEARRELHGWFGEPWWSFVCYDEDGRLTGEMRKAFPAGESCLYCGEAFDEAAGDGGQAMPCGGIGGVMIIRHAHRECLFMNVAGSLAHHEKRCRCYGGSGNHRSSGLTLRQEAVEIWRRHQAGELFRGDA